MEADRRALYTSMRMNWQLDPNSSFEPWQVDDYRNMPLTQLYSRLKLQGIQLDKNSFFAIADQFDTPEDLTEHLLMDMDSDEATRDQVYLLVFELWRRLLPEKPCLSIFCDELDCQINEYDNGELHNPEAFQDALANLQVVLDENTDEGVNPIEAFELISHCCANDLESFLYDFIAEQIDAGNDLYALELLDDYALYIKDVKWFDFLRARLQAASDPIGANQFVHQIIEETEEPDLEFNLEVLNFMVSEGKKEDFIELVKKTTPLLTSEEDFQDLLKICADFYHRLDHEEIEESITNLLKRRSSKALEKAFVASDPDVTQLYQALD